MNFADLDMRGRADAGRELQLRHPVTNEPLTDEAGNPLIVLVRGSTGPLAQEGIRASVRVARDLKGVEAEIVEDIHRFAVSQAVPFIAGFRNVDSEPGQPATVDDAERFLNLTIWRAPTEAEPGKSFAQQVLDFVGEVDRFLAHALPASNSTRPN